MDCIEDDIVFKWTNSCRLCLTESVQIDIFENESFLKDVTEKLHSHLKFLIYRGDPMPRKLCSACWEKLLSWHDFQQNCIEIDKNLKKRLQPYASLPFVKDFFRKSQEYDLSNSMPDQGSPSTNRDKSIDGSNLKNGEARPPSQGPADSTNICLMGTKIKTEPEDSEALGKDSVNDVNEDVSTVTSLVQEIVDETLRGITGLNNSNVNTTTSCGTSHSLEGINERLGPPENEPNAQIVSVIGNAVDVHKDLMQNSPSTNSFPIKEEDLGENEPVAYNLRPRLDSSINYGDPVWTEEAQPSPRPVTRRTVTPWKCLACNIHFATQAQLHDHSEDSVCIGKHLVQFACRLCPRTFFSESDLAEHNLNHMTIAYDLLTDDLLACKKCDMVFADADRLKEHSKVHSEKTIPKEATQYPCSDCGLVFIKKALYQSHRETHELKSRSSRSVPPKEEEARDLACSLCIARFKSEDLLYDHRFATHGIPDERVACTVCSLKFRGPEALLEHTTKEHQPRSVAKKTTKPTALETAKSINSGVRCRRCGRIFATREELERHEATKHKVANPYWCRRCSRRFPTRSLFLFHQRLHNESPNVVQYVDSTPPAVETSLEKPPPPVTQQRPELVCETCKIQFKNVSDKNTHASAHQNFTGTLSRIRHLNRIIYRYQCTGCPQMFGQRGGKSRHLMYCHPDDDFIFIKFRAGVRKISPTVVPKPQTLPGKKCEYCNVITSSVAKYNFHLKIKHGIINPGSSPPLAATEVLPKPVSPQQQLQSSVSGGVSASGEPTVICKYCKGSYSTCYIQRHMRSMHGIAIKHKQRVRVKKNVFVSRRTGIKCKFCGKVCNTAYNLQRHESAHSPFGDLVCVTCGRKFEKKAKNTYYKHSWACRKKAAALEAKKPSTNTQPEPSIEPLPADGHTCSICLNSYETKNLMELHIMTAHRVVPMQDDTSANSTLWQEDNNKIVREVGGEYLCSLCRVRFASQEDAAWHRAQHPRGNEYIVLMGDNRFQCTVCDLELNKKETALNHINDHAQCDIKPVLLDLPKRQLFCPFCTSSFTSEEGIRNHLATIHPEGPTRG